MFVCLLVGARADRARCERDDQSDDREDENDGADDPEDLPGGGHAPASEGAARGVGCLLGLLAEVPRERRADGADKNADDAQYEGKHRVRRIGRSRLGLVVHVVYLTIWITQVTRTVPR